MTVPGTVVFDAEPLVAFLAGEPGSGRVLEHLQAVGRDETTGYVSPVTLAEVKYVAGRHLDEAVVAAFLDTVASLGVAQVDASDCWSSAAALKTEHAIPLGDAFAAATAEAVDGSLLVGADDDFDGVGVRVESFRDDPV